MTVASLNRVKYSGADFDTHLDDQITRLQAVYEEDYNDFIQTAQAVAVIDGFAFGLDGLSFYQDRRATESYLATARTAKAISYLARQLGYKPAPATACSVDLNVALTRVYGFNVIVKKGQKFDGPNNLVFEAARETVFTAGLGSSDVKVIPCYQGTTIVQNFVGNGQANQAFALSKVPAGSFIAKGSVIVTVNGTEFEEQDFLAFGATDQFEVGYTEDVPTLYFGDGVFGSIPSNGDPIIVTYVATVGTTGRVSSGQITKAKAPGVLHASTVIPLTITNPRASVGGDDSESLDDIKKNAGKRFKSREVAVTEQDYKAIATSYADPLYGRVAVAKPFVSRSASTDIYLQNQINAILIATNTPVPIVTAALASLRAAAEDVTDNLSDISDRSADIASAATSGTTTLDSSLVFCRTAQTSAQDALSAASTLNTAITAIGTGGSDQLQAATKAALLGYITLINTGLAGAQAAVSSVSSTLSNVEGNFADIGLDLVTAGSFLFQIEAARAAIETLIGTDSPESGVYTQFTLIEDAVQDQTDTVSSYLSLIEEHQNKILADDCKANLVSVPILQFDSSGFYTGASLGLVSSLQTKLDGIKEVSQVVEVSSGENLLLPVVIEISLGVFSTFTISLVEANVNTAVDALLRGRDFGISLYLSDVYKVVRAVAGVSFTNITLLGHLVEGVLISTSIDAKGNLIVGEQQILTKGTTTITSESVPVS